jgi:hypothetical protein
MYRAVQPLYSLTQDQRKYKFRQPPEMADFDEIVEYYIERVSEEDVLDDILYVLETGFPLENMVKLIIRSSVMEGRHTIENGFLVRPILFEYLKGLANQANIEFKEAFTNKSAAEDKILARAVSEAKRGLKGRNKDSGVELVEAALGAVGEEDMMAGSEEPMPTEEEAPTQMEMDLGMASEEEQPQKPSGLMARG